MADTTIDRIKEAIPWLSPNDIQKRIAKLEFEFGELDASWRQAAYEAEAKFPGAAAKRDDLAKRLDAVGRDLENAKAALTGAAISAQQRAKLKADKERQARNEKIKKQLAARTAAARELADGLAKAVRGFRSLNATNEAAARMLPMNGLDNLTHGHFSPLRLRSFVEAEIYRQGGVGALDQRGKSFPGGHPRQDVFLEDYSSNPAAIPALVDQVSQSEAALIKLLDNGAV
jgi:hypothetical protein